MTAHPFLAAEHITHRYGSRTVLDDLSLSLHRGEVFGLLGPNGAGKSTFISMLATLIRPTSGDIFLDGVSILKKPMAIRRKMGYVPQELALHAVLSARRNLEFWAGVYGMRGTARTEAVVRALMEVHLLERADDRVDTWSGGMKRRLNIAAAIMHTPEFLVMDEPTAGVDVLSRRTIITMISRFRDEGKTILLASHDIEELETVCDRVGVLHEGRVLAEGTVRHVLESTGFASLENLLLSLEEQR